MTDEEREDLLSVEVTPEMQDILDRFPLPDGVPDSDEMNQAEIAAALNVTVNTLGKWLGDETFPVVQRGGMGKPYVLRLSHCYAWKMARDADEDLRRSRNRHVIEKLQASFLGMDLDDPGAALSAKDRKGLAEADFAHSRAAQMRRQLVRLEEVVDLLDSVFGILRNAVEGMPDRLERELGLKPEEVALVERLGSDILEMAVERIEAAELQERDIAYIAPSNQLLI